MRLLLILLTSLVLISCKSETSNVDKKGIEIEKTKEVFAFSSILEEHKLNGSILIFNSNENSFHSNDFNWAKQGFLPASTFKIPNTMIGLESGIINKGHVFEWDGSEDRRVVLQKDLSLTEAFRLSCLECYREMSRNIGPAKMMEYAASLDYGNLLVSAENHDVFWVDGESRITPFQQIEFLRKLYDNQLDFSQDNMAFVKQAMKIEVEKPYQLSGKTGWSFQNRNNGWFVGWAETEDNVYFLATNVEPLDHDNMLNFARDRMAVSLKALDELLTIDP